MNRSTRFELLTPSFATYEGEVFNVAHDVDCNFCRSALDWVCANHFPCVGEHHAQSIAVADAANVSATTGNGQHRWNHPLQDDSGGEFFGCSEANELGQHLVSRQIAFGAAEADCN